MTNDPLYVVTSVFNPLRYNSRIRLYNEFAKYVVDSGADLWTAELAFGDRPYSVTDPANYRHLQLRTSQAIWLKENALNLAVQRLPADWKYVAWVDADVTFSDPDWVEETKHALQHTPVVQMFSTAHDLGPDHQLLRSHESFARCFREGRTFHDGRPYGSVGHPGYAWAFTRRAWDDLGGLIDFAVLGSADHHMAAALVGDVDRSIRHDVDPGYRESCHIWQQRAERYVMRHIDYLRTDLLHHWHGAKANRRYVERWDILLKNKFDPEFDLKRDWQGLWQLTDRCPQLRRDCHDYFRARNEDSIDLA
jgi:hypothetical protein